MNNQKRSKKNRTKIILDLLFVVVILFLSVALLLTRRKSSSSSPTHKESEGRIVEFIVSFEEEREGWYIFKEFGNNIARPFYIDDGHPAFRRIEFSLDCDTKYKLKIREGELAKEFLRGKFFSSEYDITIEEEGEKKSAEKKPEIISESEQYEWWKMTEEGLRKERAQERMHTTSKEGEPKTKPTNNKPKRRTTSIATVKVCFSDIHKLKNKLSASEIDHETYQKKLNELKRYYETWLVKGEFDEIETQVDELIENEDPWRGS